REEEDHRRVRDDRGRHGLSRGPDRAAEPADLASDRAPQGAQARPPQPARADAAGGSASPTAQLRGQDRHRAVPVADRAARSAPLTYEGAGPMRSIAEITEGATPSFGCGAALRPGGPLH